MGTYEITQYQSGTTWLKHKDFLPYEGFHIGYFDKTACSISYPILNSRMDIARQSLVSVVKEGLEAIQKRPYNYVCGNLPIAMMIIKDNKTIRFIDTFYGAIDFDYYVITGEKWLPTEIPERIISDFNTFFEMCKKWDYGWE